MDKKTGIIIGIITAVIVILVAVVFVMEGKTEKVDSNVILTLNGENYTVDEFNIFSKLTNDESDDINKKMTEDEIVTMMNNFIIRKIYNDSAKNHDVALESGDLEKFNQDYDSDAEKYLSVNISKDDYIKYQTEKSLAQNLKYNLSDYYELPVETYNSIVDNFKENDMYKSYSFRMMTIPYEEPKSGDEATSGDATTSGDSGEKEDLSREAQIKVAENVLAKIRSGEDFETLAKEYGSMRLSFKGKDYTLVNGDIEYATSPLLSSKLGNEDLYKAVLELNSGDTTDVIEDKDYTSFQIVKVEAVEDGFVGEAQKELKEVLLNEYADDIVSTGAKYEVNQGTFMRTVYNNI